ncbi:MAG: hypothetical protein HYR73_02130 [Candidatus Eisenbacteria bacterium]|nr:hypothetical protein [Candidatus Eisenbacteria bacterium]
MKSIRATLALVWIALALAALALAGCSKSLKNLLVPNQPPVVRLTSAPYDTTNRYFYAYKLNWIGDDPDGRVVYFIYTIDPPAIRDSIKWTKTTKNEQIVFFKATLKDDQSSTHAIDYHTFVIRAVDDRGDSSKPVQRSFFSFTVAPTVQIDDPQPSHQGTSYVTPSLLIHWTGEDPDGQFTQKPIKYKFALFDAGTTPTIQQVLTDTGYPNPPDTLLWKMFSPSGFASWDSVGGETTQVRYTNRTPNKDYVFVVVGKDEAGAYTPIFTQDTNVLRLSVKLASAGGPALTMFNEIFTFTYSQGGYDPANGADVEVPAGQPIRFNWSATTDPGASVASYRWRLGGDVSDETPRTNENTDIGHWSSPSLNTTSATVGPFASDTVLFFYIEASDNNGLKSLGVIRFAVVKPSFDRALGVVNDTRYLLDAYRVGTTTYLAPSGSWPTAAEFDTFMFARGGYPYRGNYPAGSVSRKGIFQGYDFDTITTRTGAGDLTVPLRALGRFRHLIWISDQVAGAQGGVGLADGISALRYMNDRNRVNTLATYIKAGGQVWMMGSGIAHECQAAFEKGDGGTYTFGTELIPGRFLYDVIHWRNDVVDAGGNIYQYLKSPRAIPHSAGAPNYALLPNRMRTKSLALGDSLPPYRTSGFYQTQLAFSYLSLDNFIIENVNPDPTGAPMDSSVMDTLYNVRIPDPLSFFPIATYYRGVENSSLLFTAFDPWLFAKVDFVQLTSFVLENVWGLMKTGTPDPMRPALAISSRPIRTAPPAGLLNFHGSARSLIGGGSRGATRRVLTSPGHRPQE